MTHEISFFFTDFSVFISMFAGFFNVHELCASLLGDIPPFFIIHSFMIDFLPHKKVISSPRTLPIIVTLSDHSKYTKLLHFSWQFIPAILCNQWVKRKRLIPSTHVHVSVLPRNFGSFFFR